MRFRVGLTVGFAAGYWMGTKAGTERHEQLRQAVDKLFESKPVSQVTERAKTVIDAGIHKARETIEHHSGNGKRALDGPAEQREAFGG